MNTTKLDKAKLFDEYLLMCPNASCKDFEAFYEKRLVSEEIRYQKRLEDKASEYLFKGLFAETDYATVLLIYDTVKEEYDGLCLHGTSYTFNEDCKFVKKAKSYYRYDKLDTHIKEYSEYTVLSDEQTKEMLDVFEAYELEIASKYNQSKELLSKIAKR